MHTRGILPTLMLSMVSRRLGYNDQLEGDIVLEVIYETDISNFDGY